MEAPIYIRLRHRVRHQADVPVQLNEIAEVSAPENLLPDLLSMVIHEIKQEEGQIIIVDAMTVVEKLSQHWPGVDIQFIGPSQTIIDTAAQSKKLSMPIFLFVWCLLFIGAALTIMNFHEDVSMRDVQIKLYEIVTGEKTEYPLIFQIPYSIGLGTGMVLFFNHLFKKRFNEEPSPLEVEMFNYQQDLDQYVILHERKESRNDDDSSS
ncbi:stage V sporulation protein AA [Bacillus sp. FJAT-27231]|uniref:stage V sporulation protein AA n=1 Tax=Bacillus sp. FJAT-27231 TaxID=1679168 RepID=UPI000670890C|nr:stage V sporulation protein AA [Bacillus sp. FJAT-27231]KMY54664.1 stage V sporulation protein AA [Bacillus sp. FJAT-27231]